jgi:hypothetical protein
VEGGGLSGEPGTLSDAAILLLDGAEGHFAERFKFRESTALTSASQQMSGRAPSSGKGWYGPGSRTRWYGPGSLLRRPAEWQHWVEVPDGRTCWTLV